MKKKDTCTWKNIQERTFLACAALPLTHMLMNMECRTYLLKGKIYLLFM